MIHFPLGPFPFLPSQNRWIWDFLLDDVIKAHRELAKPLIVVIHIPISSENYEWMLEAHRKCSEAGIATYHSISGAAKAVARFLHYQEHKLAGG
jgi:hypothetical protein